MRRPFCGVTQVTALAVSLLMFRAGPAGAQKVLSEGIKDLATQIATTVVKGQKHSIAVVAFRELDGRASVLGTFIAEELVTSLFALGGLEIVERAMLDKVLGELRLNQTGLIDPETAKQVGRIAGVDAIVTGSITDLQSYVALNCRLIDAKTGRIFAAAQAKIVKDDDLRKIMGMLASAPTEVVKPGRPALGGGGVQTSSPVAPTTELPIVVAKDVAGITLSLKGCRLSNSVVSCDLLVVNHAKDRSLEICTPCFGNGSRLVDSEGNEYQPEAAYLGSDYRHRPTAVLASEVPMKAGIRFNGIQSNLVNVKLLEIGIRLGFGSDYTVQFHDIPLQ